MLGYKKEYLTKLIRTEHSITFKEGWDAGGIKQALAQVPDNARLEELQEGDDGEITLAFLEETKDKEV